MKILVFGSQGQLGYELVNVIGKYYPDYTLLALSRNDVDMEEATQIDKSIMTFEPDIIFNASAYTLVDRAETEPELAKRINHDAPLTIAQASAKLEKKKQKATWVVHYSTDYVFDGESQTPYSETDDTSPLGVYGQTKHDGELSIIDHCRRYVIFRTSWVYSYRGNNFVRTMLRLAQQKDEINVVSDQYGCPNYAPDLAKSMCQVIDQIQQGNGISGVYHLSSSQKASWCQFAKKIMAYADKHCIVSDITTDEYPTLAKRPAYSILSTKKIKNDYGIQLPDYEQALKRCIQQIQKNDSALT